MAEKDKKIKPKSNVDIIYDSNTVVSATDSTGLIPTPPQTEAEAESYTEIYDVPQPEVKKDHSKKKDLPR